MFSLLKTSKKLHKPLPFADNKWYNTTNKDSCLFGGKK